MQTEVTAIFEEYNKAKSHKESLGEKGIYEQSKINGRFYTGNQWYGVNSGNDRPLVRHNVIKRIGDFKISQIISDCYDVDFFADGVAYAADNTAVYKELKAKAGDKNFSFKGEVTEKELLMVCRMLSEHLKLTANRVDFASLCAKALRSAYICGAGVLYTYFDSESSSGVDFEGSKVNGDIKCEVLSIKDVYFGDAFETDVQAQPFIILASMRSKSELLRLAKTLGTAQAVERAEADSDGKILVLTKLYKEYTESGVKVKCVVVTNGGVLKEEFDTKLRLYPVSVFRFGDSENSAYGESEVTYLIPNQIAINRMITASVWSNIAAGMPMMIVNGDTVSSEISNDPGQIIKIYGTNEDVDGAVKFVCPPDFSAGQNRAINDLIYNTLTQSGAGPAAIGDEQAQNASAIERLQNAALMPLNILKGRYREFIRANALIWADMWLNLYLRRRIRIEDEEGVWYFPFEAQRYKDFTISAAARTTDKQIFTNAEKISMLDSLLDRGIITKSQYLSRLPAALVDFKSELIDRVKESGNETE